MLNAVGPIDTVSVNDRYAINGGLMDGSFTPGFFKTSIMGIPGAGLFIELIGFKTTILSVTANIEAMVAGFRTTTLSLIAPLTITPEFFKTSKFTALISNFTGRDTGDENCVHSEVRDSTVPNDCKNLDANDHVNRTLDANGKGRTSTSNPPRRKC